MENPIYVKLEEAIFSLDYQAITRSILNYLAQSIHRHIRKQLCKTTQLCHYTDKLTFINSENQGEAWTHKIFSFSSQAEDFYKHNMAA
eukprot:c44104_g1_i1 orf=54-317(+)